ncbi:MAG TPA: hypothetical protein VLT15_06225 [Acidimicrobiia bacterium]|nr:hypothetical protein [Acidimicrobiia bacterium]
MKTLVSVAFLVIEVGGVFGPASADAVAVSSGEIEVTISVVVDGAPATVVAHLVDPGDDRSIVTLMNRGEGEYAGTALTERADLVVIFEAIWADGSSNLSRRVALVELGVDPAVLLDEAAAGQEDRVVALDAATERWGWAALALGASSLSLLAWWALADYPKLRRSEPDGSPDQT